MNKAMTKMYALLLSLLFSVQANSSSFPTIESQSKLDALSFQLTDLSLDKAVLSQKIQYGSAVPVVDNITSNAELTESKRVKESALDYFHSYLKNFELSTALSKSAACKSLESTINSIAEGFEEALSQNLQVNLHDSSLLRKSMCFLFKDVGARPASTCDQMKSPQYAKFLISKIRSHLFIRQLDVVRSYFLLGLDSEPGEEWITKSNGDLQYSYEACHPENPVETLATIDNLRQTMKDSVGAVIGVRGLKNLQNDLQGLRLMKDSYNFRKGYRKVVGFAATLATLEIAAIAAASKIKSAMQSLSMMKNRWISGSVGFSLEMGASITAFTVADTVANSSEIINKIMHDKDEFEAEVRYFSQDDNLYQQNLDYLEVLLTSEIKYTEQALKIRKKAMESRPDTICQQIAKHQEEIESILSRCPSCYLQTQITPQSCL